MSADAASRVLDYQRVVNRNSSGARPRYAGHRDHLMRWVASVGRGADICILGAGNCSDLDPDQLARDFSTIHLVDLDGEALERGREAFSPASRSRVVKHPGVDLSGFLGRLDDWGDEFPDDAALDRSASSALQFLLKQIGQRFHVVLSDCTLSQLYIPYRQHWLLPAWSWSRLFQSIHALHLATAVGVVAPAGHGVIAFDVLDSSAAPALRGLMPDDHDGLDLLVRQHASVLYEQPSAVMRALLSPALKPFVASPRLTPPWLWNTDDTLAVYGLIWDRPA